MDAAIDRALDSRSTSTRFCLSIDVEEYFHAEVFARSVSKESWETRQCRAAPFVERIAAMLAETGNRATFFVLGWCVPRMRSLLRDIAAAGHEIACHGQMHDHLSRMTPTTLTADLRRARGVIEDTLGCRTIGYRAPTFSITRKTAWALDVLLETGFEYDASIFPIRHDRYGVPDAPLGPFRAIAPSGRSIVEFPPMVRRIGPLRLPVGGGGYLRLLPGAIVARALRHCAAQEAPAMLYLHPWELDPDQPRLPLRRMAQWRHRVNLHTTERKLGDLLKRFRFDTAARVLAGVPVTKCFKL